MANQPTSVAAQPPPALPNLPGESSSLTNYLTRFSLWCRNGFAAKLDAATAAPGILLMANDAPAGATPKVFLIQVNTAGTIVAVAQPLGGGSP